MVINEHYANALMLFGDGLLPHIVSHVGTSALATALNCNSEKDVLQTAPLYINVLCCLRPKAKCLKE